MKAVHVGENSPTQVRTSQPLLTQDPGMLTQIHNNCNIEDVQP